MLVTLGHKHVRHSTKSRGKAARQESEPALISANLSFPFLKQQKNKPTDFQGSMNLTH